VVVGLGVAVAGRNGVGVTFGAVTLKLTNARTPPIVTATTLVPSGSWGTRLDTVNEPSLSVVTEEDGGTEATPMVTSDTGRNGRKLVPVTVNMIPMGPSPGLIEMVAAGTLCSAVAVAVVPATAAVTVLVEGMMALMALKKLEEIRQETMAEFGIEDIAIAHRIGPVEIGEISLVVAVASPHRKEAFFACHKLVDRLKETVPIWKKEVYEDGSRWVACEDHEFAPEPHAHHA